MNWNLVVIGCLITAGATSLGALPATLLKHLSARMNNILVGFCAGIMLAASSFSLIIPALELSSVQLNSRILGALLTAFLILFGAFFLFLCNRYIPHEHFISGTERNISALHLKRIWLFVLAITIHNFPEGLAVGSGVASQSFKLALPIVFGIGLQDLPEGFVVAAALISVGYTRKQSIYISILTGVVEAVAAVLGFIATAAFVPFLSSMLAFAGGAMIYVVIEEMIPEIQTKKISSDSTGGILFGFVLMMFLDTALNSQF